MIGSTGIQASWPAAAASIPSHITGASAGTATRFAGSETTETVPKWSAISGAVASVAEIVSAAASASARRQPPRVRPGEQPPRAERSTGRIPATAAKLSCQPMSPAARGSSASVTQAASSSAYQRERGRPASAATTRRRPSPRPAGSTARRR